MAWGKVMVQDQKKLFIQAYLKKDFKIAQLCRQFDISRPTAYETIRTYHEKGFDGLKQQSKRPHTSPNKTSEEIEDRIIREKLTHNDLGPDKILFRLQKEYPLIKWPSSTTIGKILDQNGLVERRKLKKANCNTKSATK